MSAIFLTIKKRGLSRGITLIETIFYVVILTLVMGVIVQMLVAIGGVYKNIKVTRELEISGTIVMDNMLREIRNASSVVITQSVLGVSPGAITVSGVDEDDNPYNTAFTLSSGLLNISKNGETPVPLTSSSGAVNHLLFTRVTSAYSEGVRIEMEISHSMGSTTKSEKFYGFAVLRGSYK